jgi:hypothetical protein
MSTVAEILSSAQDGKLIENLAQNFGLTTEQMNTAVEALTPALNLGLRNATSNPQVLEQIVAQLVHPAHQAAFYDPSAAHGEEAGELGAQMVSHLFGSSSAAGQVAQIAARDAGLRPDVMARLLPVLASVVLGGLFKSFDSQGMGGLLAKLAGTGALGTILSQLGTAASTPAAPSGGSSGSGSGGGGGLLGGLLGVLLGSLLGGGSRRQAPPQSSSTPAPAPGGGGLEDILGQLIKTLNAPAPASAGARAGQTAELQDVLDRVFPSQ